MNKDAERVLRLVSQMAGEVVSPELAKTAGDLAPYTGETPEMGILQLMKNQIFILMLRDLGGEVKYAVRDIDNDTRGFLVAMEHSSDQMGFRFWLEKKPNKP